MATPNALTFNDYVTQLANLAVVNTTTVGGVVQATSDAAWFNTLLPQALNYAELRIQRDLDLEALLAPGTYSLTNGTNILNIPVADFYTIQSVGIVVNGVLTPLLPVSKEYIQNVWGDPSATAPPSVWAQYGGDAATYGNTSMVLLFGPYADVTYSIQVTGTKRAASLYTTDPAVAGTTTTFISTWLPDLMLQASMVLISQYQRNFGAANGNDEQMPGSYESAYQNLLKGAIVEEARRRWQAPAWSSQSPTVVASPSRGA